MFKLVARRHDEAVTSERASVYITLAKARVWASEGWDVTITDPDGRRFGPADFESHIAESNPVIAQAIIPPLAPEHTEPEPEEGRSVAVDGAAAPAGVADRIPGNEGEATDQTGAGQAASEAVSAANGSPEQAGA